MAATVTTVLDANATVAAAVAAEAEAGRDLEAKEDHLAASRLAAVAAVEAVRAAEAAVEAANEAARDATKRRAYVEERRAVYEKQLRKRRREAAKAVEAADERERRRLRKVARREEAEARAKLAQEFGGPVPELTPEQVAEAAETFGSADWTDAGKQRLGDAIHVMWQLIRTGQYPPAVAPDEDGLADTPWPQPIDFGQLQGAMHSRGLFDDMGNLVGVRPLSGADADSGWNDLDLLLHVQDRFMENTGVCAAHDDEAMLYVFNSSDQFLF